MPSRTSATRRASPATRRATTRRWSVQDADCRDCHVEHLGDAGMLDVSNRSCVACHGDLKTKTGVLDVANEITSFAGHPQLSPLRAGKADQAAIRFNHNIHLTSDKVRQAAPESEQCAPYRALDCASCHQVAPDGMLMRKVTFDQDCRCCHAQDVQGPLGSIEAPHRAPEVVQRELAAKLLVLGVGRANEIFSSRETSLPGVRDRGPIDESRSLGEYERGWLAKMQTRALRAVPRPGAAAREQQVLLSLPRGGEALGRAERAAGAEEDRDPAALARALRSSGTASTRWCAARTATRRRARARSPAT